MITKNKSHWLYAVVLLLATLSSCDEKDPAPVAAAADTNTKINSWIKEEMDFWYLWNTQLPAAPDKSVDPETFFNSLKVSEDRFSWIEPNYKELLNSLQGISKEAGYEYVLYKENESSDNVILQVIYVKPGSPAETAGLKRGDVVSHINDQQLTTTNYRDLLDAISKDHTLRYKPLNIDSKSFGEEKTVSLSAVEYAEDPNYLSKVINVNGRKIGYYVYNFFSLGTDANPNQYDTEMDKIFADFKSQGITDLVLDLRFNSGGSETAATSLASYLGKGIDNTKVFARRSYNSKVEDEIVADPDLGRSYLTTKFAAKANNIGNQLTGGRVYVLTSSRTASASELIINALKPFMDVFLIGNVTYGKNVGSITLYDKDDATNSWGLQPIVVKVYNSLDQSDYSSGFTPNVLNKDNSIYLYPLGDPNESLLNQAIGQITGAATSGRERAVDEGREVLKHSLDQKRRSFNLTIDQNIPDILKAN
jgi:carboxyl-terminal processing protease